PELRKVFTDPNAPAALEVLQGEHWNRQQILDVAGARPGLFMKRGLMAALNNERKFYQQDENGGLDEPVSESLYLFIQKARDHHEMYLAALYGSESLLAFRPAADRVVANSLFHRLQTCFPGQWHRPHPWFTQG